MTVNPIAAALLATELVGEPITFNLVAGLVAVFFGIWIATTEPRAAGSPVAGGEAKPSRWSMTPKSRNRLSEKDHAQTKR